MEKQKNSSMLKNLLDKLNIVVKIIIMLIIITNSIMTLYSHWVRNSSLDNKKNNYITQQITSNNK